MSTVNCWKDENKQKEAGIAHLNATTDIKSIRWILLAILQSLQIWRCELVKWQLVEWIDFIVKLLGTLVLRHILHR